MIAGPVENVSGRSTMADDLPEGWMIARLGDVLQEVDVRACHLSGGTSLRVLSLTKNRGLVPQEQKFKKRIAKEDVASYKVVKPGWIVYNPYVIWEGAIHAHADANPGLISPAYVTWETIGTDPEFLGFAFRTNDFLQRTSQLCSGAVNRRRSISKRDFQSIRIVLPPLEEQRAIANALRTVQRALAATEQVVAAVLELKHSLSRFLFTYGVAQVGKVGEVNLTETEVGSIPEEWVLSRLGQLLREPLKNGHSAKEAGVREQGCRTLTLSAVTRNDFSLNNTKITNAIPHRVRDLWLESGDILIERGNTLEYVGLAALFEGPDGFAIYPDLMVRVRADLRKVDPKYLVEWLVHPTTRSYYRHNASGTAGSMPKISQGIIEATQVPTPALHVQSEIAAAFRVVDRKVRAEESRLDALDSLSRSLRHHLMTGTIRLHHPSEVCDATR